MNVFPSWSEPNGTTRRRSRPSPKTSTGPQSTSFGPRGVNISLKDFTAITVAITGSFLLSGCMLPSAEDCPITGSALYWHQPEIYRAIAALNASPQFYVDVEHVMPTPGFEAEGLDSLWPGNYQIESVWREIGPDRRIYVTPYRGDLLRLGALLPTDWDKGRVKDEVENFLEEVLPEVAHGPGSDVEQAAVRISTGLRSSEIGDETWLEAETEVLAFVNWTSLYAQRMGDPKPLIAGAWRFDSGSLTVQVRLTKGKIWSDDEFGVTADIGGDVWGPIVDGYPASMRHAKAETKRVFQVYGLPAPSFSQMRMDDTHTCFNSGVRPG